MHSIELEKKVRLPDPAKVLEGAWKLLKRSRQQMDLPRGKTGSIAGSAGQSVQEKKRARIEADRHEGQGTISYLRTTIR